MADGSRVIQPLGERRFPPTRSALRVALILCGMALASLASVADSTAFPATGQVTCWDGSGKKIDCHGTGQDGEIQAGAALSFTDNGDGTITDNNTGLAWEKKSADGTIHDRAHTYTWDEAFGHVAQLNAAAFAGHQDWRLPNIKELQSIRYYDNAKVAVPPEFNVGCDNSCSVLSCSCTSIDAAYWSSTSVLDKSSTWAVSFLGTGGGTGQRAKQSQNVVRAVRGTFGGTSHPSQLPATGQTTCWNNLGQSIACQGTGQDGATRAGAALSYTDNGDGTITDNNTGLVWEKNSADDSIHDRDILYTWSQAFARVALLNSNRFAGHDDWRLPNVKELESIVNYGQARPAVSPEFNTGCVTSCTVLNCSCTGTRDYWTSTTTIAADPSLVWSVDFRDGESLFVTAPAIKESTVRLRVRAVRGGATCSSPAQLIERLAQTDFDPRLKNAVMTTLDAARVALLSGDTNSAQKQLADFVTQVNALGDASVLAPSTADALTACAHALAASL